jgi:hypothetical protein
MAGNARTEEGRMTLQKRTQARVAAQTTVSKKVAADYVKHIPEIELTMDNGEVVRLSPAAELHIPSDPFMLRKALEKAPGGLAFWSYQTERALKRCRDLERALAHKEGVSSLTYREWYDSELKQKYTEDMIRSRVSIDAAVDKLRTDLNAARDLYGVLRATRDAVEHRIFALRKLIGHDA